MNLKLAPEEVAALRLRERATEESDLQFEACPCCAVPLWRSTQRKGKGLTLVSLGSELCGACAAARYQAPAAFDLVIAAIRGNKLIERWSAEPSSNGDAK